VTLRVLWLSFFFAARCVLAAAPTNGEIRITSYNVENYLSMPRRINGKLLPNVGKPESEKTAVTRMIGTIQPDILGLQEIGEFRQLKDVQKRLREAGMDFPYSEYLQGNDTSRHVALLSRFPIVERHSQGELPLWVNGVTLHSPRGILDVTVEPSPGFRIRILCLHLKAKLEVAEYNESDLRLAESKEIRRYVRDILRTDPGTRLVLMGDFNDTKNEKVLWQIEGKPDWPDSLMTLPLADDRGEYWTEYWSGADVYSRIDYIMVSKKLEPQIDQGSSGIARPSFWSQASDHCPVTLSLKSSNP
jgi:endonuclease/exonuclease/phosphatase family metal-dependent hydrolase